MEADARSASLYRSTTSLSVANPAEGVTIRRPYTGRESQYTSSGCVRVEKRAELVRTPRNFETRR